MVESSDRVNHAFAAHLAEAGLTARALARELNQAFGPGTSAATAPYYWRDSGGVPRSPLPALTAHVISRIVGRVVTVADLWPERPEATDGTLVRNASTGMNGPWTLERTPCK